MELSPVSAALSSLCWSGCSSGIVDDTDDRLFFHKRSYKQNSPTTRAVPA